MMMLDVDGAATFLLEHGLIDAGWIVDGQLTIDSEARRNRNLRVEGPDGKGYLIKQPDDPGYGGHDTLRTEAAFLRFCRHEPAVADVAQFMPLLIDCFHETARLVFELVPRAAPFHTQLDEKAERGNLVAVARELGKSLATLHRCFQPEGLTTDSRLGALSRQPPWAMGLHMPPAEMLAILSAANHETLRILQTEAGLADRLDRLRQGWQPQTVIHGDVKFDNVLVQKCRDGEDGATFRIWIVDWEMVQIGDPAWDLAGALQDFLVPWVRSMPMTQDLSPEDRIAAARLPLANLKDAIRALWDGYRTTADFGPVVADEFLQRSVGFSAARLLQSAFEMAANAAQLTGAGVLLLQIASNILAEPRRAQVQLYGIPWSPRLT
jgi:Phosphotransferase enzyme family